MSARTMIDREVRTTRTIAAPRDRVFAAWTDPEQLARWWGPNGFTNTFHRFELKPDGVWDFTMHGPDGRNYENTCVFKEIVPNERIVFDHLRSMHIYRAEVDFTAHPEGTWIDWRMRFNSAEELRPIRAIIEQANEENLDRLDRALGRS